MFCLCLRAVSFVPFLRHRPNNSILVSAVLTCLEQSLTSLKPHTEQHTGQNEPEDRQTEGLPAAARMRSKTLCRQEPASLSKDSLQSRSEGMSFSTRSWGWILESQSHMLHQQHMACHSQLVNTKPPCRHSKKCHVHPLVTLAAEGSASTTQASVQLFLPLSMPPSQACSLPSQPLLIFPTPQLQSEASSYPE